MTNFPPLAEIAAEPNWLVFARRLRAAMAAHEDYGFASPDDVISRVADLSRRAPASLRNPLYAEAWLARHATEVGEEEKHRVAMTNVLLLAQIHAISPNRAQELAPGVYSGNISRKGLKEALEDVKRAEHAPGGVGHVRWHRARSFEDRALAYLREHITELGFNAKATVHPRTSRGTVPYDFDVRLGNHVVAAVEVKSHRQKITHRVQIETLAVAALLRRDFPEVLIVTSNDWQRVMPDMARLRDELRLDCIRLATLQEEERGAGDPAEALKLW